MSAIERTAPRQFSFPDISYWLSNIPIIPILLLSPIVIFGLFGQFMYPHDPTTMDLSNALRPPAWTTGDWSYVLGTDRLGRDLLSRLMQGARASLLVSVCGVGFAGIIGVTLGMIAGYFKGTVDIIIMRIVDTQMSIPSILLIILLSAVLGAGLATIIICIAVIFWTTYARVVRGQTLSITQREYVALAQVTGCGHFRILTKYIFPNLLNTILVLATIQLGTAIMVEASITFLGMGIQPPDTAWGLIIADGRQYMATAWWIPTFAGLAIMLTVLGANLLGDWVRDKFDPRLRQL